MLKNIKNNQKGFTIIEVLIVLAIAGLIMLIVFLAIPQLQRNQRNNARNGEASRIATAVGECLGNRNGVVTSCMESNIGTKASDTASVTAPTTPSNSPVQVGQLQRLEGVNFTNGGSTAPFSSTRAAGVWYGRTCNSDGAGSTASTNSRDFVVLYSLEPNVTRCVSS